MRRILRIAILSLCLLSAIAAAVYWFRSGRWLDTLSHATNETDLVRFSSGPEGIRLERIDMTGGGSLDTPAEQRGRWIVEHLDALNMARDVIPNDGGFLARHGFRFEDRQWHFAAPISEDTVPPQPPNIHLKRFLVGVPHWFALLLALTPAGGWALIRYIGVRRRRSRAARGLCLRCGYDLRGSPGRCPECGHVA